MLAGCLFLLAGMTVTFGAIATTTPAAFLAGTAVAGAGFGLAYLGAFRMILALATPDQRAGLVTAVFIVGYLAFSIPALIAGVATTKFGLYSTALVYCRVARRLRRGRGRHPAGPFRRRQGQRPLCGGWRKPVSELISTNLR